MELLPTLSTLFDEVPFVIGGHGYDFADSSLRGDSDNDGDQGLPTVWIAAVLLLALVTVALLAWVSPSVTTQKLRALAPKALIAVIIAAPPMLWAALESEPQEKALIVERVATGLTGSPEFLISLSEDDMNTLRATGGKREVRLQCLGRDGRMVLDATQKWPFVLEAGYDYAHAHQPAKPEQLQQAERCRLLGTRVRLEADVRGTL